MPATPQVARWFVDENSLGVAKALAYVRGDITWPGAPDGPVSAGAADTTWLPIIGRAGLVVLARDKRIRSRPLERQALLNHEVRACSSPAAAASPCSTSSDSGCGTGTTSRTSSPANQHHGSPALPARASGSSTPVAINECTLEISHHHCIEWSTHTLRLAQQRRRLQVAASTTPAANHR